MKVWTREKRQRLRSEFFRSRKLRIGYRGQLLAAKVVDSSDHGLGVEMSAPLEIDSFVSFVGIGLRGRAQVMHCRPSDDGVFRAGLKIEGVSFRNLDVSSQALPSETVKVHNARDRLLNAGAIGEPQGQGADDLVEGVEEMHFGGTQDSSEDRSRANVSESMSQLARVSTQEATATDSAGQAGWSDREGQASTIPSEMAQTIPQAVKQELRDPKLDEIFQGWTETQQQIAELKANVSEQHAELATTKETLSRLCAETQTAQQLQASRVDSILERLAVQEAELPKLNSIEDLSGKKNGVVQRLDLLSKASGSAYEVEKQRQTAEPVPDQTEAPQTSVEMGAAELPASSGSTPPESPVEIAEEEPEAEPGGAPPARQWWISSRVLKLAAACVTVVLAIAVAYWISSDGSSQQAPKVAASTIAPEARVAVPLRGVVLDEGTGGPITHATLYSGGVEVTTNARGEFKLPSAVLRGSLGVKGSKPPATGNERWSGLKIRSRSAWRRFRSRRSTSAKPGWPTRRGTGLSASCSTRRH